MPRAERLPPHYKQAVWWGKKLPEGVEQEVLLNHRALYVLLRGNLVTGKVVVGIEEAVWGRVQPKHLDNRLKDINWLSVYGRLPVREVMYRHKLARHPHCVRAGCQGEESIWHLFWECYFAKRVWFRLGGLLKLMEGN